MPITMKELAKLCSVSRGTVDRALNNRPGINEETRNRIMEKAKEMGYKTNYLASSLKKGKTLTIGIIVFDLYNQYFANLVHEIEQHAKTLGFFVYLTLSHKDPQSEEDCVRELLERQVDGLLVVSVNKKESYIHYLENLPIPIVSIGNKISDKITYVDIDNQLAMKENTHYATAKNYSHIVYVSPSLNPDHNTPLNNLYAQQKRYEGFIDGMKATDHDYTCILSNNYLELVIEQVKTEVHPLFICSTDLYALEILKTLTELGFEVKRDYGLIGFDGLSMLNYVTPALSTVAYPFKEIGNRSVDALVKALDSSSRPDKELSITCSHRLITGDTL